MTAARRALAALAVVLGLAAAPAAWAADLTVTVTGLADDSGNVHIALYDNPATFPDGDGMMAKAEAPIRDRQALHVFRGLTPGRYAVAVYHDANDNDEFDQGLLGIPLEDFAFSSGARAFLGPPGFEDAAVDVAGDTAISIPINQ
ncbi:MAG: DUF2141 domain-containing protein [Rhodospirillaceae bacterium]